LKWQPKADLQRFLKLAVIGAMIRMMVKLISTLLLVSTLFANLAWAADTHAEAFLGHGSEWSQDKSPAPGGNGNSDGCDHCCHGLAHLTGLSPQTNISNKLIDKSYLALSTQRYHTRFLSPPTPPPNA